MKKSIILVIVAYLFFVLASMPAATVVGMVTLPQGVQLGQVSGSVWNGKASAVQVKNDVLTNVSWQLSPLSMLLGSLSSTVQFGSARNAQSISGTGDIATNFAFDHFSANDFTLRYPAADFVQKMKLNIPTQVGGRIILNLADFDQGKPYCETLDGKLIWQKASMQGMSGQISLGKLDADLGCKKGEVELKVTKKNPLGLQLTSLIGANNKFTAKGFVKPNGDMPDEVHNAVKFLGSADSKGRFPINF